MTSHKRTIAAVTALFCLAAAPVGAQSSEIVTITGRPALAPSISGFGNLPAERTPLQAMVFGKDALTGSGIGSLAELTRLDAGLSDAYNAEGYWSYLTVRGFVIDNRSNYRRDGLPINAETSLSLANKERVEVLKGASGIQAGTSAPGGLVNLVVKRPQGRLRDGALEWRSNGSAIALIDLADRFGSDERYGLRLNVQAADLKPAMRDARGSSRLLALAMDGQLTPNSKLELEIEDSHRSQPSTPGFSLLGHRVPDARNINPRTNLNNQPWSLPVVMDGESASLRWQYTFAEGWRFVAHGATQRLRSDDRVAFPYGCYDAAADVYWSDRYCPDGSFDLYDFRSKGERRRVDALDLRLEGALRTGHLAHTLTAGVLSSRIRERYGRQAYNYSGSGHIDANVMTPAAPDLTEESTNRDERNTETYVRDVIALSPHWSLWAGLRHTRLDRSSVRTDGSRATSYQQSFTTPWLALARTIDKTTAYLSWGEGVESEVTPNRERYGNRGEPLPALKSRQWEVGLKHDSGAKAWSLVAFDIQRPLAQDLCPDETNTQCVRAIDGNARHHGIEAAVAGRQGRWAAQASAMWLRAQRQGARDATQNGLRPTNVPSNSLRLQITHDPLSLPGLSWQAALSYEGDRSALPDNSVTIPPWAQVDLAASYRQRLAGSSVVWRLALLNAADRRAWRESPYQFGHSYLFPMAPRRWRASMESAF